MHSLWLVPNQGQFTDAVQELISKTVPSNFPNEKVHDFNPHVTLTSDIDPEKTYGASPQEWLDNLSLPAFEKSTNEVLVELDQLASGERFFQKLIIKTKKPEALSHLAARCRREAVLISDGEDEAAREEKAQTWAKDEYVPHMSLMYGDISKEKVDEKLDAIESQCGWAFGMLFDCCGGTLSGGGKIVLVDTGKPISDWKPTAERKAPWARWILSKSFA